jgi:pyrimidine operon attenuation protein/uracil phosphoribosyltransferase
MHTPDAERLYERLRAGVPPLLAGGGVLVGIHTGGAWLAERLHRELRLEGEPGLISSALHRDDFAERGLSGELRATRLPFEVDGARIVLVDDVLHTGRTIRAVVNELFDFGRPRSIALAVLVDRAGRELPIGAAFAAETSNLDPAERLTLARGDDGRFRFETRAARAEAGG